MGHSYLWIHPNAGQPLETLRVQQLWESLSMCQLVNGHQCCSIPFTACKPSIALELRSCPGHGFPSTKIEATPQPLQGRPRRTSAFRRYSGKESSDSQPRAVSLRPSKKFTVGQTVTSRSSPKPQNYRLLNGKIWWKASPKVCRSRKFGGEFHSFRMSPPTSRYHQLRSGWGSRQMLDDQSSWWLLAKMLPGALGDEILFMSGDFRKFIIC